MCVCVCVCVCDQVQQYAEEVRLRKEEKKKILKPTVQSLYVRTCKIVLQYVHSFCTTVHLLYGKQAALDYALASASHI